MPTYFSRAELQYRNEELERKLADALRQVERGYQERAAQKP